MLKGALQSRRRWLNWIGLITNRPRRRKTPDRQGDRLFGHARAGARAEAFARDGIGDDAARYSKD